MITVRSASGRPVRGSSSCGNSSSTSAISLPRSPQPTYTITSASHHLASASCSTVLPVPKPPGSAARPPRATGNSVSRMRWPVIIGALAGRRARTGRGVRTGHGCRIATSCVLPFAAVRRAITSSSPYSPSAASQSSWPSTPGGTRISCSRAAATAPRIAPVASVAPVLACGTNRKRPAAPEPRPAWIWKSSVPVSGRSSPSKMPPSSPGPSRTERARPLPATASPGSRPVVSSYTCATSSSPLSWMTSPSRWRGPTDTASYTLNDPVMRARSTGPPIQVMRASLT